jgi:aspartate/methionine/tyrosine aminotransferase
MNTSTGSFFSWTAAVYAKLNMHEKKIVYRDSGKIVNENSFEAYHEVVRKCLNINNPPIGFVKKAINALNILVVPLASFWVPPARWWYRAVVADKRHWIYLIS